MILQIDRLHALTELSLDFAVHECNFPQESGTLMAPIHLDAQVRRVGKEIVITGQVSSSVQMNCARCLKPHQEELYDSFDVTYLPSPEESGPLEEIELNETDMNIVYYTGEEINLAELARDQVLLLLPVKPLCKADCAGLCPSCGKDLNEGPCSCSHENVDSRFAVLKNLLPAKTSEKSSV